MPGDIFVPAPLHPLAVGIVQSTLELLEHKLTSVFTPKLPRIFWAFGMRGNTKFFHPSSFVRVERIYEGFQKSKFECEEEVSRVHFWETKSREDCLVSFTGLGHFPLKP